MLYSHSHFTVEEIPRDIKKYSSAPFEVDIFLTLIFGDALN